mgnify:CR=1 FL=1
MSPHQPHNRRTRAILLTLTTLSILGGTTEASAQSLELTIGGYIQGLAIAMDQSSQNQLDPDTGQPLNDERFALRRGRLVIAAHNPNAYGRLELDGSTHNGPQVQLKGAVIGLHTTQQHDTRWPLLEARLGLMASPFGAELQRSSRHRPFVERSNAINAFFPGTQDVGAEIRGQWRFVRYQLALMNSEPLGSDDHPGQDPTASKDLVARVGVVIPVTDTFTLEMGTSVLQGEGLSPSIATTKDSVQWIDANENGVVEVSELQPIPGVAGRPAQSFDRSALGADATAKLNIPHLGALRLSADLYWALNLDRAVVPADPVTQGRDLRELGWMVSLEQALTRHALLAVRYDHYNPDADDTETIAADLVPRDRSVSTLAINATWTTFDPMTVSLEYNHNDNNDGRNADGSPTRLKDDRLLVRAQVEF